MTASLLQLQVLSLLACVACGRFFYVALRCDYRTVAASFFTFFFATVALFVAAVL